MEAVDVLKRAVVAVEEANVPDDLREIAFAKALAIIAGNRLTSSDAGFDGGVREPGVETGKVKTESTDLISRIASNIGLAPERVDRVFDVSDGQLIFSGDVSALGRSKAERVAGLAILFLAGRRWANLDDAGATPDAILRAEIDRVGLLDGSNYTKHTARLKSLVTKTGSGVKASYKIKYDGLEKAKQLTRELAEA